MHFKNWIDDIKTDDIDQRADAPAESFLPGEKEADKILFAARDQIVKNGIFHFTPETAEAEMDIDRTYKAIINGGHDFTALSAACDRWIEASRKAPAPAETVSLFDGSEK